MNSILNGDQIASLVRSAFKLIGAFLIAHGYAKTASFVGSEDLVGYVITGIGLLMSHLNHSTVTPPPAGSAGNSAGGSALTSLFLGLALLPALALMPGCASNPETIAYKAAGATAITVDGAMSLWGAYVAANHPGTNAEAQVKNAYVKYQTDMAVVTDGGEVWAAASDTNAPASAAFTQASSNAKQDMADLESLIESFGVKLQ